MFDSFFRNGDWAYYLTKVGFFIIVIVFIFLVIREILMWYWKINERISLLEDISDDLSAIRKALVKDFSNDENKKQSESENKARKP